MEQNEKWLQWAVELQNLFCSEIGYQTPIIDCRAAIFQNDKILLVQEKNGTYSAHLRI